MFGFIILVIAIVWTLSARKPLGPVLGWGSGLALAAGLLGGIGILPFLGGANAAGLGAAFGSVVGFTRTVRHQAPRRPRVPDDFGATHAHDNLALNARDQIWVRDTNGEAVVLSKYEVREWTHLWQPDRGYKGNNRIEIRTIRLDRPVVTAAFRRHPETVFGAPKNAREAEEWHARLGAFMQRQPG
ncbi:hypothetical protein J2X57_001110 [Luteibacter sp. 1214]|uniref:hypothetical protein n=1 Tax=Luteibacter sp. 1214 TaxID=2817735 RepID=UPI002861E76C|nr:hypothetical protein [Luteibacter sp. 1214]MDR6641903.1 hypothetical protein [Luteibacter sp. 1214]